MTETPAPRHRLSREAIQTVICVVGIMASVQIGEKIGLETGGYSGSWIGWVVGLFLGTVVSVVLAAAVTKNSQVRNYHELLSCRPHGIFQVPEKSRCLIAAHEKSLGWAKSITTHN